MKIYIILLGLVIGMFACTEHTTEEYSYRHMLFFSDSARIDTANVSFTHYPGKETLKIPFIVKLIGEPLKEDLAYKVQLVDSVTTAINTDYDLPEPPVFRAGKTRDTLWITLHRKHLEVKSYLLKVKIVENENFKPGYYYRLTAQLRYNNIKSKPTWWDSEVVEIYLGTYSDEKYDQFIKATGEITLEGKEPWERRLLCLELKNAIEASLADDDPTNDITEVKGNPMIIPCY